MISKPSLVGIALLLAIALVGIGSAAMNGNGAIVNKNSVCGIYTGEYGTIVPEVSDKFGFLYTENSIWVKNQNNWQLTCHGKITENFPSQAVNYGGDVGCTDLDSPWNVIITPSGEVTLTCRGTFT